MKQNGGPFCRPGSQLLSKIPGPVRAASAQNAFIKSLERAFGATRQFGNTWTSQDLRSLPRKQPLTKPQKTSGVRGFCRSESGRHRSKCGYGETSRCGTSTRRILEHGGKGANSTIFGTLVAPKGLVFQDADERDVPKKSDLWNSGSHFARCSKNPKIRLLEVVPL